MQIRHVLVKVDNQEKALAFYTAVLGFEKKADVPMGQLRWLTVSSPEGAQGVELVLEANSHSPAREAQQILFDSGFPATVLTTTDIHGEYEKLRERGVKFRGEPKNIGPVTFVQFDDTCGNVINLVQRESNEA